MRVAPFANQHVTVLDADQIVGLMRQAGFTDQDILRLGTDLRNALARHGGAKFRANEHTEAIFVVHSDYIYVASMSHGSVIYPLKLESGKVP